MIFNPKLAPLALGCALLVAACGGGGGSSSSTSSPLAPLGVDLISGASSETVSLTDSATGATTVYEVSKYLFSASVTDGKYKGMTIAGDLLLGAKETGSSELKGTLLLQKSTDDTDPAIDAAYQAALAKCRSGSDAAYAEARAALKAAVATLKAALAAATTQAQIKAARDAFEAQYQAISKAARDKANAACTDLLKLGGGSMETKPSDEKEDDDDKPIPPRAIPVEGKMNADGSVSLKFEVKKMGTIKGTGTKDAKGNWMGTFTGPDSAGKGTWKATVATTPAPSPAPAPAPAPSPAPAPTPAPSPAPAPAPAPAPTPAPAPAPAPAPTPAPAPAPTPAPAPAPASCGPMSLSWTVGTSMCNASVTGTTASGMTALVSDVTAPTTGSATYVCTNGVWSKAATPAATCITAAPPPPPAPSPAAVAGKASYAMCIACHGADPTKNQNKIQSATSASKTLSAIANNTGGMGYLSATIGATEAANIAAYVKAPF
jgi:hypothetical protein